MREHFDRFTAGLRVIKNGCRSAEHPGLFYRRLMVPSGCLTLRFSYLALSTGQYPDAFLTLD
jgi:hypothetical protein